MGLGKEGKREKEGKQNRQKEIKPIIQPTDKQQVKEAKLEPCTIHAHTAWECTG